MPTTQKLSRVQKVVNHLEAMGIQCSIVNFDEINVDVATGRWVISSSIKIGPQAHAWHGVHINKAGVADNFFQLARKASQTGNGEAIAQQIAKILEVPMTKSRTLFMVLQQGGSTQEWYCHSYNDMRGARGFCKSAEKSSYTTTEPYPIKVTENRDGTLTVDEAELAAMLSDLAGEVAEIC